MYAIYVDMSPVVDTFISVKLGIKQEGVKI